MLVNTNLLFTPQNWWRVPILAFIGFLAIYFVAGFGKSQKSEND